MFYISTMPLLSILDLVKVYQTDEGMFGKTKREVRAVNGFSLDIIRGGKPWVWSANPAAAKPPWDA